MDAERAADARRADDFLHEVRVLRLQLRKLVNVVEVVDFTEGEAVIRELVLAKVAANSKTRSEIMQICDIFRTRIVNVAPDSVIVEIIGDESKTGAFINLLEPFGIIELARTGVLAQKR
jgi:acetolactate synthase-1/3 small subunit